MKAKLKQPSFFKVVSCLSCVIVSVRRCDDLCEVVAAERRAGGMIDAGVRVQAGVDIYGPCSGLARCCPGGTFRNRTKLRGPRGIEFQLLKERKKGGGWERYTLNTK